MVSLMVLQLPDNIFACLTFGGRSILQHDGYVLGPFTGCPTIVINYGLKLAAKFCSECGSIRLKQFHHDGACPAFPPPQSLFKVCIAVNCVSNYRRVAKPLRIASAPHRIICSSVLNTSWRCYVCCLTTPMTLFKYRLNASLNFPSNAFW
jgi:hypothetical protein